MAKQTQDKINKESQPKVVAVLIEGDSEYEGLNLQLEEFFDELGLIPMYCLLFESDKKDPGGDITSRRDVDPSNIDTKICKYLICHTLHLNRLLVEDIACVIHIMDTDGAYIPNELIQEVKTLEHPEEKKSIEYYSNHIKTLNFKNASLRNQKKSENMNALAQKKRIDLFSYTETQVKEDDTKKIPLKYQNQIPIKPYVKTVPYFAFFYSCNFDHFTCGERNLPSSEKTKKAEHFSRHIAPDLEGLKKHLNKHPGTLKGKTHKETWEFIAQELNSLQQHTNIHLLLEMDKEDFSPAEEA